MPLVRPYYNENDKMSEYDYVSFSYLDWALEALKMDPGHDAHLLIDQRSPYLCAIDMPAGEFSELTPMFMVVGGLGKLYLTTRISLR